MIIRRYRPADRKAVEHIHFETGLLGSSMNAVLVNKKYWAEEAAYYLDAEPHSIFVAEDKGKVVGYLFGCLDDRKNSLGREIRSQLRHIPRLLFMHPKDRKQWGAVLRVVGKFIIGRAPESKIKTPPNAGHIHINLLPAARGKGVGTKLLKAFFAYAKENGVATIHAGSFQTRLNPNTNFWKKNGFKVYSRVPTIFWQHIYPDEKIYHITYVKKL